MLFNDLVAQLVEHLPFKERVLGSSPSQITTKFYTGYFPVFFYQPVEFLFCFFYPGAGIGRQAWLRAMCPLGRAGSSPAPGTISPSPFHFLFFFF